MRINIRTEGARRRAGGTGAKSALPRAGALVLLALLLLAGACVDEEPLPPNLPPHTYLAVTGESLNVVNYHIALSWGGTDQDGYVIGFAYRWDGPWSPAPGDSLWEEDPAWTFTTATRDTFDVPVVGSYAERTFSVCAIDNQRAADPLPAAQRFRLANAPPLVSWTDVSRHPTLNHPSLPAVSFAWTPEDYDGRETIAEAVMWLDTIPGEDAALSRVVVIGDTVGAFFPEHFRGSDGEMRYGVRTAFLQLFDQARTASDTISWTWNVVAPAGEYLLIDNAWPAIGPARIDDLFWRARMDALFPGNYHVYDVQTEGPFRSRQEALPIFQLFKGVVWYGIPNYSGSADQEEAMRAGLTLAEESLAPYVDAGGRVLISAHNLMGTNGGLSERFCRQVFGVERVYSYRLELDYISDFALDAGTRFPCGPLFGGDSLTLGAPLRKSDGFALSPSLEPLLWAPPGSLDPEEAPDNPTEPYYLGALARKGSGSIALFSTLLTRFQEAGHPGERVEGLMREMFLTP